MNSRLFSFEPEDYAGQLRDLLDQISLTPKTAIPGPLDGLFGPHANGYMITPPASMRSDPVLFSPLTLGASEASNSSARSVVPSLPAVGRAPGFWERFQALQSGTPTFDVAQEHPLPTLPLHAGGGFAPTASPALPPDASSGGFPEGLPLRAGGGLGGGRSVPTPDFDKLFALDPSGSQGSGAKKREEDDVPPPANGLSLLKAMAQVKKNLPKLKTGDYDTIQAYLKAVSQDGPVRLSTLEHAINRARQKGGLVALQKEAQGPSSTTDFYRWKKTPSNEDYQREQRQYRNEQQRGADIGMGESDGFGGGNFLDKNGNLVVARGFDRDKVALGGLMLSLRKSGLVNASGMPALTDSEVARNQANFKRDMAQGVVFSVVRPLVDVGGYFNPFGGLSHVSPAVKAADEAAKDKAAELASGIISGFFPDARAQNLAAEFQTMADSKENAGTRWGAFGNAGVEALTSEVGGKWIGKKLAPYTEVAKAVAQKTLAKVGLVFFEKMRRLAAKGIRPESIQEIEKMMKAYDLTLEDQQRVLADMEGGEFHASEIPKGKGGAAPAGTGPKGSATPQTGDVPAIRNYLGGKVKVIYNAMKDDFVQQGESNIMGAMIRRPEELAERVQLLRDPRVERTFHIFVKDGKVIDTVGMGFRLPGRSPALASEQGIQWINAHMKKIGADGFYVVHNHPSGVPTPSGLDIINTQNFLTRTDGFKGHLITNHNFYAFIDANGNYKNALDPIQNLKLTKDASEAPDWLKSRFNLNEPIDDHYMLHNLYRSVEDLSNKPIISGITSNGELRIMAEFKPELLQPGNELKLAGTVSRLARSTGSARTVLSLPIDDFTKLSRQQGANLLRAIRTGVLTDAMDNSGRMFTSFMKRQGMDAKFLKSRNGYSLGRGPSQTRTLITRNGKKVN